MAFEAKQSDAQKKILEAHGQLTTVTQEQSNLESFLEKVTEQVNKTESLQTELKTLLEEISKKTEKPTTYFSQFYAVVASKVGSAIPERVSAAAASVSSAASSIIPDRVSSAWESLGEFFWSKHEKELTEFWSKNGKAITEIKGGLSALEESVKKMISDNASAAAPR
ncbi:hypothetical protein [Candidatus Finniella inopinata]|uniref:Uncharacterized protein n=1 Tax=Candidatus Finniella inopinata TaxID=1696036 RepID=A0A4Q7DK96_9PROT|nr:hypothetical protein [Candidatus Finniella inopinata]RZI46729.1 hypothetical protein EQU50_01700 [Candidatus Finniella inopinata]